MAAARGPRVSEPKMTREPPAATRTTLTHEEVWRVERFAALRPGVGKKISTSFRFARSGRMDSPRPVSSTTLETLFS